VRQNPDDSDTQFNLGNAYYWAKRYAEAIEPYKQTVRLNPDLELAYSRLGTSYAELNQYEPAIQAFEAALRLNPQDEIDRVSAGLMYFYIGKNVQAIANLKEAIRLKPEDAEAHNNLGYVLRSTGADREAILSLNEAIRLEPDHALAHYNLGVAYHNLREYNEAVEALRQAARLDPSFPDSYFDLGLAYALLGRDQEAVEVFKNAIALKPNFIDARFQLGRAYFRMGNHEAALKAYDDLKVWDKKRAEELYGVISTVALPNQTRSGTSSGEPSVQATDGQLEYLLLMIGIIAALGLLAKSVQLVRSEQRMIVERFGAYNRTCGPGWHLIMPFVDRRIMVQINEFLPAWKAYGEEQLREKLVHDYYQKAKRDEPAHFAAKVDVPTPVTANADVPAPIATNASDSPGWWVHIDDKSHWVPDTATLHSWVSEGRVGRDDLVWDAGTSRWIRSTSVQELQAQFYPLSAIQTKWRYDLFLAIWPLFALLIGLIGVLVITGTVSAGLLSALRSLWWEETEGRITQSAVLTEEKQYDNGSKFVWYRKDFRYEYWVANQRYESTRIGFSETEEDNESRKSTHADQVVSRYHPDDRVTVYFDPVQPASATLDRGEGMIAGFFIGLIMAAGATFGLRLWWRRRTAVDRLRKSFAPTLLSGSPPPPPPNRSGVVKR
jgi:tetratricopeptide (TPR) repeat protein